MDYEYDCPLTPAQFATVLQAAYLAESLDLVTFDADLRDALNSISHTDNES
jgi:hypothetical protein